MMKKLIAMLVAAVLCLSCAAFAEGEDLPEILFRDVTLGTTLEEVNGIIACEPVNADSY